MKLINIATKFLAFSILICLASTNPLCAALQVGPGGPGMPIGPMPGGMPMPAGSPMDMPKASQQQAMPMPGNMPAPSAEEIEQAFAKVEEIQKNDPEMFRQLEDAGKNIIKELAKQDPKQLEAFAKSFGLEPEDLLAEAEKPASEEPETYAQEPEEDEETFTEEAPVQPSARPTPKVSEVVTSSKKPIPVDEGRVRRAIAQVAEHIESLRNKMASSTAVYEELRSLELDLLSLALLIAIVDSPVHISRIAAGEYDDLVKAIEKLAAALIVQEQLIQAFRPSETKYDLLGVSPQVTTKQLDKVFKELKKRLDPKVIEKELKKKGLKGDDLKRQVKAARITFSEIEEAYDLIKDPITRRDIVDRAIELEAKQQGIDLTTSKAAIADIREALSDALYRDEIISKLEDYLEKYAPEELKQKKASEKEEKKRLEEQKKRARQSPIHTPGESFEPNINLPSGGFSGYGSGTSSPTWYPESSSSRYQPVYPDYTGSPDVKNREKEGGEKEKPRENIGAGAKEPSQSEKESKKVDSRTIKDIIGSLDKKFKEFAKAYDNPANKKLITNIFEASPKDIEKLETDLAELNKKTDELLQKEAPKAASKEESDKPEVKKTAISPEQAELTKKMQEIDAALEQHGKDFTANVDKLRTDLKIDLLHKEFDILSKKVSRERSRAPRDDEDIAWEKFKEAYESSEVLPEPIGSADKPEVRKTSKERPSIQSKFGDLGKKIGTLLKRSTKKSASDLNLVKDEVLASFNKQLTDITGFKKKVDNWFMSRIPTVEPKKEQPKEVSKTESGTEKK